MIQKSVITSNNSLHNYNFYETSKKESLRENIIIENITAILQDKTLEEASIRITDGIITEIGQGYLSGKETRLNCESKYLLPGLIDLHSDSLEKVIEPRPRVIFPTTSAITDFDKTLPTYGITTMFHCVAFVHTDHQKMLRNNDISNNILRELLFMRPYLKTRTCIHIRYDILNQEVIPLLKELATEQKVNLLSLMDHTPGQGQFKDAERYVELMSKMYGRTTTEVLADVETRKKAQADIADEDIWDLADIYTKNNIPIASHDDDSTEKVQAMSELGVTISEFPINMDAIQAAHDRGMHTIVGAPNIIIGKSHSGNLSARSAVQQSLANIICSDYIPSSIFHSLFLLKDIDDKPFHEIVALASLNPAQAVGIDSYTGSITEGKWADLIICSDESGIPKIERTFVQGYEVYKTI
jgi:alpha-D-ribose 1-methylphosphonate 5-triphosphate diphosphatase